MKLNKPLQHFVCNINLSSFLQRLAVTQKVNVVLTGYIGPVARSHTVASWHVWELFFKVVLKRSTSITQNSSTSAWRGGSTPHWSSPWRCRSMWTHTKTHLLPQRERQKKHSKVKVCLCPVLSVSSPVWVVLNLGANSATFTVTGFPPGNC